MYISAQDNNGPEAKTIKLTAETSRNNETVNLNQLPVSFSLIILFNKKFKEIYL